MSDEIENSLGAITGVVAPASATVWSPLPGLPPSTYKHETKKKRIVRLPSRFTKKVLVAFVDEDNYDDAANVIWAANLEPESIEMTNKDGETYLNIKLSLEDVYGNLEGPDED